MKTIKYVGPGDYRAFNPIDFAKVGVEVEEPLTFVTNRPIEVEDHIADILTKSLEDADDRHRIFVEDEFEETDEEPWVEPVTELPPLVREEVEAMSAKDLKPLAVQYLGDEAPTKKAEILEALEQFYQEEEPEETEGEQGNNEGEPQGNVDDELPLSGN